MMDRGREEGRKEGGVRQVRASWRRWNAAGGMRKQLKGGRPGTYVP